MEKISFVFLIRDDKCWEQLFSHIAHLRNLSEEITNISIVVVSTAMLSCLKCTHLEDIKSTISYLSANGIKIFMCANTLYRYGFSEDKLLPEIDVAYEGGLMKIARMEILGYHTITLG